MKDQKKTEKKDVVVKESDSITINESLNKYSGPEYAPEKFKKLNGKIGKIIIHK